ncbi:PREDICTED: uncharacterized protein LOC101303570 [Fragaria vesca subsp. vesca]
MRLNTGMGPIQRVFVRGVISAELEKLLRHQIVLRSAKVQQLMRMLKIVHHPRSQGSGYPVNKLMSQGTIVMRTALMLKILVILMALKMGSMIQHGEKESQESRRYLYLTMNQFKSVKGPRKHLMNQLKSSLIQLVEIEDVVNIILGIYFDELWNLYACLCDFLLCSAVDKSLIEMPEGQIDPQKIPLRDLIRLREYTECSEIKEAAKLKTQASNHRDRVSTSSFSLNYASFMKKPRPVKWSEQDTELFYEGIELFGSEFHMVALLFPGRTRDHIKFKHKKEKRQNPLRIDEALHHQPKDNSKYARVINEMLKVARQTQKSNSDELSDIIDLEEEELTQNNNEEVTTPELDKIEDMETDVAALVQHEEAAVTEVHSPMKSNQSGHGDDFGGWSDEF